MPGIRATMHEFKERKLHSGSKHGPKVTSRKQAIAIALSEEREDKPFDKAARPSGFKPRKK